MEAGLAHEFKSSGTIHMISMSKSGVLSRDATSKLRDFCFRYHFVLEFNMIAASKLTVTDNLDIYHNLEGQFKKKLWGWVQGLSDHQCTWV